MPDDIQQPTPASTGMTKPTPVALLQACRVLRRQLAAMEEGAANQKRLAHVAAWLEAVARGNVE